ncbi:MAG: hypothetical protein GC149_06600 [Gammaproteobacteria bacterium]|nr:hypothetical protein [Gammaproteobacteria bacterium]
MQNNYLKSDDAAIEMCAQVLATTHMRIFELAYREWYGSGPALYELEHSFTGYLFEGTLPCWVRAYLRQTLQQCAQVGMELPVAARRHNVTFSVNPAALWWTLCGVGVMCCQWLARPR